MAIEDIFRALEEQADEECKGIMDGARAQAERILGEAEEQAGVVRDRLLEEAERLARARSMHSMNSARLAAKKEVAALKGQALDEVFSLAAGELAKVRDRKDYPALFSRLAAEAMESVDSEFAVVVDAADRELAEKVAADAGVDVKADITTAGGLVVSMKEGRIARRNTFEDRLVRVRHVAQSQVAEILFG